MIKASYDQVMLVKLLISTVAVAVTAWIVPGVHIADWFVAAVTAIVLGILNSVLRPILLILTIPVNILTLGLFTLVINSLMVLLATKIVPGFSVDGWWTALAFSLVLSVVNWFLGKLGKG